MYAFAKENVNQTFCSRITTTLPFLCNINAYILKKLVSWVEMLDIHDSRSFIVNMLT
jgi:hypothetical protein